VVDVWDEAEKRISNEMVRRTVANPPTDSMMEIRRCRWLSYKLGTNERVKELRRILGAGDFNATTNKEASSDQTPRIHK
jgi:hypothetical protein